MTINIAAIDHVVFRVADLQRMMRFYVDVLGARVEKEQTGIGLYQLRLGTSLVDLVPVDGKLGAAGGAAPGTKGGTLITSLFACCHGMARRSSTICVRMGSPVRSSLVMAPRVRGLRSI